MLRVQRETFFKYLVLAVYIIDQGDDYFIQAPGASRKKSVGKTPQSPQIDDDRKRIQIDDDRKRMLQNVLNDLINYKLSK
jgi:hypothetical protein